MAARALMATGVFGVLVGAALSLIPASTAVAAAGINKEINFQGKVTNSDGTNVADGSYSFTFKLYTASSGGTAIWTETKSLSVTAGIFQTNLGDTAALPGSVDFNTDSIYLGMSFNGDPEMSPRIRFTATPYAFNSDTLDGLDSTQFARTDASNSFTGNSQTFKNGTDSATSFQIQPAGSTTDVFDVDTSNSRVGVGLNAPAYKLDVAGDINTSTGYRVGGVAGVTQSCSAGNFAVSSALSGGIQTGTATCFGTGSFINNQTTTQTNANFDVQSAAVGSVTGVLEDLTSQTADLLQFQDASGNPMTTVDTTGYMHVKRAVAASDNVFTSRVTADTNDRFTLGADGKLSFGPGSAATDVTLSRSGAGVLSSNGTLDAATKVTAPAFDTATGVALNVGTSTATSVVIGKTTTNFTLQGASGVTGSKITGTSGSFTSTVTFTDPTANDAIKFPDESGTICLQGSSNCGFLTTANVLAKNAHDTSSASYVGNLYDFTNTNTGAAGVLSLTNSGTNAALAVTQSSNPTSGQALIVANNTNATPSGNLIDLQAGGVSQFHVAANGVIYTKNLGTADTTSTLCLNSSNQIASCQGGGGLAFLQGGNSFGAAGDLGTNDSFALNIRTNSTTRLTVGASGGLTLASGNDLTVSGGAFSVTDSTSSNNASASSVSFTNTNAGATATTVNGVTITPTGSTNTNAGANKLNAVNLPNVTTVANNLFTAVNVGTGYDNILAYNGTQIISGAGILQNAGVGSSIDYTNLQSASSLATVGALTSGSIGSGFGTISTANNITTTATIQGGTVNATTGFQANGAAGVGVSCGAGQANLGAAYSEGILTTAGTCTTVAVGTFLAKNAHDTSSASYVGNLYDFSNTNTGAAGVLSLTNSGTNSALSVTQSGNPSAGQALILANNNNATPSGNLLDLQAGGTSELSVSAAGNLVQIGGTSTTDTINGQRISAAANFTGTVTAATSFLAPLFDTASAGTLTVGSNNASAINIGNTTSNIVTTISGTVTVQPTSGHDSATAFVVNNANAQSLVTVDTAGNNITLGGNNSGALQSWSTNSNALPAARWGAASVLANGYIYVLGGSTASTDANAVNTYYYAPVASNGTVGSWTSGTVPYATSRASAVVVNNFLYLIGGNDGTNDRTDVNFAKLNADGSLGSWTSTTALSSGRSRALGLTTNGYIYVIGGSSATVAQNTVFFAKPNANGTISSWGSTHALNTARQSASGVVANGYVYVVGGSVGNVIQYAKVNSDGTLPAFTNATTTLPSNESGATSVVANGYMYELAGSTNGTNGTSLANNYYAKLNADGSLGSFTATTSVPDNRWGATSLIANGYIYEIGGSNTSGAQSTVYFASTPRLQVGGSLDLVGLGGQTLTAGGQQGLGSTGGSITAGDIRAVGTLQVQGQGNFAQGVDALGNLSVGGYGAFQNAADSTTSFMVQNSSGNQVLTVDTSGAQVVLGKAGSVGGKLVLADSGSANSATIQLGGALGSAQTYNLPTTGGTFCMQSSSACGFATGSGAAFVQGGNSFSAVANLGTNDANDLNIRTNGNTRLTVTSAGNVTLAAGSSLSTTSGTGTITQNYSATSGTGTTINATDSASSGATTEHAQDIALTGTDNATGSNALTGLNFNNVTAHTNNTYTAINVGTGFTDLLDYNGTQLVSGAGKIQNAAFDSALTYSNITGVGALVNGSIASGFGTITTANTITGTTINGTTGINTGAGSGTQRIDSSGNLVSIGNITGSGAVTIATGSSGALALQPAAGASLTSAVTKNAATGNETAFDLSATINKATSGNYTGIKLNVTETSAPGTANKLIDLQVASASEMSVSNTGVLSVATGYQIGGAAAAAGHYLRGNGTDYVDGTIQAGDISGLAVLLAPTTTANNTVNPGSNNAVALTLRGSSNAGNPDILDIRDSSNVLQASFDSTGVLASSKNISTTATVQGGTVNATTGFSANGTAGGAVTCSAGQALTGSQFSEGILVVTGTCSSVSGGTFLAKNSADTSQANITAGNYLYAFTNTSSAVAGGVLKLDNGTNTGNALYVTASGNPAAGNALIFASDTAASPSGNLIDLQAGSTPASVFSVSAAGVETLKGGQTADITVVSAAATSNGNNLTLVAGTGGSSGNHAGGDAILQGGTGTGSGLSGIGGTARVNGGTAPSGGAGGLVVIAAANGGSSAANGLGPGGSVTIQGGTATGGNNNGGGISLTAGNANGTGVSGGSISLAAGTGATPGTVNIKTPVFTSTTENFTQTGNGQTFNVTQSDLDTYGTIVVTLGGAFTGGTVNLPSPTNTTAGRIILISASSTSASFTLSATGMTSVNMASGNTSTLIWNGTNWSGTTTASSLQQVYNNTSTSPASIITTSSAKNLLFQAGVGFDNANLFQVGNSLAAPLLHVDSTNTATGANIADNSGLETGATTGWSAYVGTGSTVSIATNSVASNLAAGLYSLDVNDSTTGSGGAGVDNDLSSTALSNTSGVIYNVSFNVKVSAGTSPTLAVQYFKNNTDTSPDATCTVPSNGTPNNTSFFKYTCYFTNSGNTKTTTNHLRIVQTSTSWTGHIYIDNLFVGQQGSSTALNSGELQVGGPLSQGLTIFQLDSFAADPVTGSVNQNMLGSMYYSTTLGRIQCYEADGWGSCGAAPDSNLILEPEYAGAVLNPGPGADSHIGTMTANVCSAAQAINATICSTSGNEFNYYQWTTSQVTSQTYSIYVKYQLPPTFGGFLSTPTLSGRVTSTTDAGLSFSIFTNSGATCGSSTNVITGAANTWFTTAYGTDPNTCGFNSGDLILFRVDMSAKNNADSYAGRIQFSMKGK